MSAAALTLPSARLHARSASQRRRHSGIPLKRVRSIDVYKRQFCTCDDCRDVFNKEGCNTGAVLMMTNRAAAVRAEAYPGVYVSMLAYHGTDAPPKTVRPLDNVRISYCFYISNGDFYCNTHHIDDENCPGN